LTGLSYTKRTRLRVVGTVQIKPPLPKQKMGPLAGPILVFTTEAGLGSETQVQSEAGTAGRHN